VVKATLAGLQGLRSSEEVARVRGREGGVPVAAGPAEPTPAAAAVVAAVTEGAAS
jgi:hypothetical protein